MANNFQIIHLRETFFRFFHTYLCVLDDLRKTAGTLEALPIVLSD